MRPLVILDGQIRQLPDGTPLTAGIIAARLVGSQSVAPGNFQTLSFSSAQTDSGGHYSALVPNRLTLQNSGFYLFGFSIFTANVPINLRTRIRLNSSGEFSPCFFFANSSRAYSGVDAAQLNQNDFLTLETAHNEAAAITVNYALWAARLG